ncbi:GNAT family N-acetyltransferase [[Clostridium] innocuum]|nr:GNAT family N-acetyltransferase [[Clostridium] innocuum]
MLQIRQAVEADKQAIEAMYKKRVRYNDAHGIHQWDLDEVNWEAFSRLYTISDYYVGVEEGRVVCGLFIVDEDALYWPNMKKGASLYLHKICVDPACAGKGYADAMIQYFIDKGRREGYPDVRLDVREHKDKLRRMYERNGFQLYKTGRFLPAFTTALYIYPFSKEV